MWRSHLVTALFCAHVTSITQSIDTWIGILMDPNTTAAPRRTPLAWKELLSFCKTWVTSFWPVVVVVVAHSLGNNRIGMDGHECRRVVVVAVVHRLADTTFYW